MFRLTTNVTVSRDLGAGARRPPGACPRSPPAASPRTGRWLIGRELAAVARAPDSRRHQVAPDCPLLPRPDPRRGMKLQYFSLITSSTPCSSHSGHALRVHAQPLGQRVAPRCELLAHPVHGRERVLRRDVVAVGGQAAEVGGALVHERQPPVGQVRGSAPTSGISARQARTSSHMASSEIGDAHSAAAARPPLAPAALRAVGDLGRLRAVVARWATKFWRITSWRWPCSACTSASASSAPRVPPATRQCRPGSRW